LPVSPANNARLASSRAHWRGYLDGGTFILVATPFCLPCAALFAGTTSLKRMQFPLA
jgi:hypothetical protein